MTLDELASFPQDRESFPNRSACGIPHGKKPLKIPPRKRSIPAKLYDYVLDDKASNELDELKITDHSAGATSTSIKIAFSTKKTNSSTNSILLKKQERSTPTYGQEKHGQPYVIKEDLSKKNLITKVSNGFKCGICSGVFTLRGNAKAHLMTHTDHKPFKCDFKDCGKQMRTKENLRRHKLSHLGIKLFECPECQKKFSCNLSLQEHLTLHTGEKRLCCQVCGMKFRQLAVLRRHMITHSDEKPFSCDICGKKFSLKIYVRSHMKTHTGEKPFSCLICKKSFAHASDLNRHKIVHTGEKPYKCSFCPMRCNDASSKRRHEREHNKALFVCHLCNRQFIRAGQLRVHLMKEHSFISDYFQGKREASLHQLKLETAEKGFDTRKESDLVSVQRFMPPVEGAIQTLVLNMPKTFDEGTSSLSTGGFYKIIQTSNTNQVLQLQAEDNLKTEQNNVFSNSGDGNALKLVGINCRDGKVPLTLNGDTICVSCPDESGNDQEQFFDIIIKNDNDHSDVDTPVNDQFIDGAITSDSSLLYVNEKTELVHGQKTIGPNEMSAPREELTPDNQNITNSMIDQTNCNTPFDHSLTISSSFIENPDLHSQEYYNWIAAFCEDCKNFDVPLSSDVFKKINHVHKTLNDFLAIPIGVISDKNKFKILMGIAHDLSQIISKHLSIIFSQLKE